MCTAAYGMQNFIVSNFFFMPFVGPCDPGSSTQNISETFRIVVTKKSEAQFPSRENLPEDAANVSKERAEGGGR
jgi:hypothetical protein